MDRHHIAAGRLATRVVIFLRAFVTAPAIVFACTCTCRHEIDLFVAILPDIGNPQIIGQAVKAKTPGIAQPARPHFIAGTALAIDIGIARWNAIVRAAAGVTIGSIASGAIDVNAQNLAQHDTVILPIIVRIAATAAISRSNVEITITAKLQLPTIVVGIGLRKFHQHHFAVGVSQIGIATAHFEARNACAQRWGVIDIVVEIEVAVILVIGVKHQPQKPRLARASFFGNL